MSGHLALSRGTHAIALFGLRQNDRWLPHVLGGHGVGGMDFNQVVSTALESVNLLIGHALSEFDQGFVLSKKVLTVVRPVFGSEGLHLTINGVGKRFDQGVFGVTGKQPVPVAAPDQFDHIPTRAFE